MRFHVLGLTHLPVSSEYSSCAFTQKIVKMCRMLMGAGHTVFLYGAEGSTAPCTEFVQTHRLQDIRNSLASDTNIHTGIGYDWKKEHFRMDFENKTMASRKFIKAAIEGIRMRMMPDDFLMLTMGFAQAKISDAVKLHLTVEPGIGYTGCYAPYKAFESSAIRHYLYGVWNHNKPGTQDGKFYDRVIPNYWDENDWPLVNDGKPKGHALYVGRFNMRKGVTAAADATRYARVPLWVAGQGAEIVGTNWKGNDTPVIDGRHMKYLGVLETRQVNEAMANADCLIAPTIYIEPFGGVTVEAMLSGTPVITTDYGVFPETVVEGVTGFRCNTMQDMVNALRACREPGRFDPKVIRAHAEKFLMRNVWPLFQKWFDDLYQVYLSTLNPPRSKGFYQVDISPWEEAQDWEKNWWQTNTGSFINTLDEDQKQVEYAKRMGLSREHAIGIWFKVPDGATILDIGSNAVSLLLKCRGYKAGVVCDPLEIPEWAVKRYEDARIAYMPKKAEDIDGELPDKTFDEAWLYNVLQHVENPEAVVKQAIRLAKRVRVCEWVNIGACPGHPHDLKVADLERWFGRVGEQTVFIPSDSHGCRGTMWSGCFEYGGSEA